MKGHEALLEMRRKGKLPSRAVWVTDGDNELDRIFSRTWMRFPSSASGLYEPCVVLDIGDIPEALDFRFCVGLQVHLTVYRGTDRAQRLFKAIRAAGPALLGCVVDNKLWYYSKEQGGNGRIFHG